MNNCSRNHNITYEYIYNVLAASYPIRRRASLDRPAFFMKADGTQPHQLLAGSECTNNKRSFCASPSAQHTDSDFGQQ